MPPHRVHCGECDADISYANIARHRRERHGVAEVHHCQVPRCKASFARKSDLKRHRVQHRCAEHKCDSCGREFKRADNMETHKRRMHRVAAPDVPTAAGAFAADPAVPTAPGGFAATPAAPTAPGAFAGTSGGSSPSAHTFPSFGADADDGAGAANLDYGARDLAVWSL